MAKPPEEVRLGDERLEVVVLPDLGARLHRIRAFGVDLLAAPDDPAAHRDAPYDGGAYVMAPWANRIEAGQRLVAGRRLDLAASFPDGSAIHGLVHSIPWRRTAESAFEVEAGGDRSGWPWRFRATMRLDLASEERVADRRSTEVRIALGLENLDDGPMPGGIGLHPWFRLPVEVAIHADRVYHPIEDTPRNAAPVAGALDRRAMALLPVGLDDAWTNVATPAVALAWPERGHVSRLSGTLDGALRVGDATHRPIVVAASLPGRAGVAVELQTNAPQGLRRLRDDEPDGLVWLEPGMRLELELSLRVSR